MLKNKQIIKELREIEVDYGQGYGIHQPLKKIIYKTHPRLRLFTTNRDGFK